MELSLLTAVGLVVALAGFRLLDLGRRAVGPWDPDSSGPAARGSVATDLRAHAWKWAIPGCLLLLVAVEGRPLASIGWRIESPATAFRQVAFGLVALFGLHLLLAPLWTRVGDRGDSVAAGLEGFATLSIPERLFVAVTAGATEETAFHGYAIERLLALTGSVSLAGGVGFAAFAVGHLGDTWDRHAVARIAQPALVTTLLYLQFRSLPVLIAIHAVHDAAVLLLVERFAEPPGGGDDGSDDEGTAAAVGWLGGD